MSGPSPATRTPRSTSPASLPGMAALAIAVLAGAALASPVGAQEEPSFDEEPDTVRTWTGEAELSGSVFFGNTDQTIALTRATVERIDSAAALSAGARFNYGEAALDGGEPSVIKRSWSGVLDGEYRPFRAVSPFGRAGVESSLEKRIDRRFSAGAGARVDVVGRERFRVDWSLLLRGEKTYFDPAPPEPGVDPGPAEEELLRWATTLRVRRAMDDEALVFTSETSYRPELDAPGRFTLDSVSSIAYALSDDLSLKLTFVDEYDSEAEARGARSNNDGQILFGLLSTF